MGNIESALIVSSNKIPELVFFRYFFVLLLLLGASKCYCFKMFSSFHFDCCQWLFYFCMDSIQLLNILCSYFAFFYFFARVDDAWSFLEWFSSCLRWIKAKSWQSLFFHVLHILLQSFCLYFDYLNLHEVFDRCWLASPSALQLGITLHDH